MCEMLNEKEKCITVDHLYEDGDNDYTRKMLRIFNNEVTVDCPKALNNKTYRRAALLVLLCQT